MSVFESWPQKQHLIHLISLDWRSVNWYVNANSGDSECKPFYSQCTCAPNCRHKFWFHSTLNHIKTKLPGMADKASISHGLHNKIVASSCLISNEIQKYSLLMNRIACPNKSEHFWLIGALRKLSSDNRDKSRCIYDIRWIYLYCNKGAQKHCSSTHVSLEQCQTMEK